MRLASLPVLFLLLVAKAQAAALPVREFALNPQIQPCDDFYQYVCSKEIAKFKMPAERSRYTFYFSDGYENFLESQKTFFVNLKQNPDPSPRARQILDHLAACRNEAARKNEEKRLVREALGEIGGLKTRNDLFTFLRNQAQKGSYYLFSTWAEPHTEDPKRWRVLIRTQWLTLTDKAAHQNADTAKALRGLIGFTFKTVGLPDADDRAEKIVKLEAEIAPHMLSSEERSSRWDASEYWSRTEFLEKFPAIAEITGIKAIPAATPIHQYMPKTLNAAEKILQTADLETLKSFVLYRLLRGKMDLAYPEYEKARRLFFHQQEGWPAERRERDKECIEDVQENLGLELASEMTANVFKSFPREKFIRLVEKVKAALVAGLSRNTWLTEATRQKALTKIKAVDLALLYPGKEGDWRFPPYAKLSPTGYLGNIAKIYHAYDLRMNKEIKRPRNLKAWSVTPLEFDAYYFRAENRFYFPGAFAMKPIYDPSRNESDNIAAIGSLIGHELGHALDKLGSQYDERGRKISLFAEADQKKFAALGSRFVEQFNKAGHDGELTLAENMADNVGMFASFEAAFSEKQPGNKKAWQNHFIQLARMWCTAITDAKKKSFLKEDTHSLPEARINEQLKHMPAFSEAFECREGSKMRLPTQDRLRIW